MIMEALSIFSSCESVFTGNSFSLFVPEELFYFHVSSARQSLIKYNVKPLYRDTKRSYEPISIEGCLEVVLVTSSTSIPCWH